MYNIIMQIESNNPTKKLKSNPNPKSFDKFLSHFDVDSLPQIRWFHRANSPKRLEAFLNSNSHVAEGDVMLGNNNEPIMKHPFAKYANLSTYEWINTIIKNKSKGAKFDFKNPKSAEMVLEYVKNKIPEEDHHRIFLHADIIRGPLGKNPKFPTNFFENIGKELPSIILSFGFTTEHIIGEKHPYTKKMINEMCETIEKVSGPCTIAIRAESFFHSEKNVFDKLLDKKDSTLTIWSGRDSYVGKKTWPQLFLNHYAEKAFIDLINQKLDSIPIDLNKK